MSRVSNEETVTGQCGWQVLVLSVSVGDNPLRIDELHYHRLTTLMKEPELLKRRLVRWAFISAVTAMMLLLIIIGVAKSSDFRKAARWHQVHGDVLRFDGHELSLPQDWWERDGPSDGKRVLVKASSSL